MIEISRPRSVSMALIGVLLIVALAASALLATWISKAASAAHTPSVSTSLAAIAAITVPGTVPVPYVLGTYLSGGSLASGAALACALGFVADEDFDGTKGNALDHGWVQATDTPLIFDLGFKSRSALLFPSVDHGPVIYESLESTVWGSNNPDAAFPAGWTLAALTKVYEDGFIDSECADESDDYASLWTFPGTDVFQYIAVHANSSIEIAPYNAEDNSCTDEGVWCSGDNEVDAVGAPAIQVDKHWSQTDVCFERNNDPLNDDEASEDPIDFYDPLEVAVPPTLYLTWAEGLEAYNNDEDDQLNEDPSECGGVPSLGTHLLTDEDGNYQIQAVVKKNLTVSSYNPGQVYAVSTVKVGTANLGLQITENYSDCTTPVALPLLTLNPKVGGGGGSVVVVILDATGDPVQVLDATSLGVVVTDTTATVTLGPQAAGTTIMVYVKFGPGQKDLPFVAGSCENRISAHILYEDDAVGAADAATAVLQLTAKP